MMFDSVQPTRATHRFWLTVLFIAGVSALGWQMLWTTQLGLALGHETFGVLGVVTAFFGGLALGNWYWAVRWSGVARPLRLFAWLELTIGAWGCGVTWTLPSLTTALNAALGAEPSPIWHWFVAFAVPWLTLLPATLAMGATLAVAQRAWSDGQRPPGASIDPIGDQPSSGLSALYAANTAGACVGALMIPLAALPELGFRATAMALALANVACAVAALALLARTRNDCGTAPPVQRVSPIRPIAVTLKPSVSTADDRWRAAVLLGATGLLGIGFEVLAIRVLSQVTENTVYSFALLLAAYLVGVTLGAAWQGRCEKLRSTEVAPLLFALALTTLFTWAAMEQLDRLEALLSDLLPSTLWGALTREASLATAVMLAPASIMGALFTRACRSALGAGWGLGHALAFNTLGSALAPIVVGVVAIPLIGSGRTALALSLGYALLALWYWRGQPRQQMLGGALAGLLAVLIVPAGAVRILDLPAGAAVISHREDSASAVSVVRGADGISRLIINNRVQEGSTASGLVEQRLALLPLLWHGRPQDVLMLGLGTGYSAYAAAADPALRVRAVELLEGVIETAPFFMAQPAAPKPTRPPRIVHADARRHVQSPGAQFDVIIADLFHPGRSGAGSLYTVEHFEAVRSRLAPGGVFCQWLALHQMEMQTLRHIVAAYLQVYPDTVAVLASNSLDTPVIGLLSRPGYPAPTVGALDQRVRQMHVRAAQGMRVAQFPDVWAVAGSMVADAAALRRWVAQTPAHTDDRPWATLAAARDTYAPRQTSRERLAEWLQTFSEAPQPLQDESDPSTRQRAVAYWSARRDYLELGLRIDAALGSAPMAGDIEEPLLRVYRLSPDFTPARDALLAVADAHARRDSERANRLRSQVQAITAPHLIKPPN